jgi:hypothetical protein
LKRVALIVLLIMLFSLAWAEELGIFIGEATVSLANLNLQAAKKKATVVALAQAVEQALGQVAAPEEIAKKKAEIKQRILSDPERFVVSFTVVQSEERANEYYLSVEARIRLDALREVVRAILTPPPAAQERPKIAVVPYRRMPEGFALDTDLDHALRARFVTANQGPADTQAVERLLASPVFAAATTRNPEALARLAAEQGIRVLVLIDLHDETPADRRDIACRLVATIRLIDVSTRAEAERFSYTYPSEGSCADALDQASRELFAGIADAEQRHGLAGATGNAALLVEVNGVHGYTEFQELQALIRNRPQVQAADLESFHAGGHVVFRVVYAGPATQFADDLGRAQGANIRLKYVGRRGDALQFMLE